MKLPNKIPLAVLIIVACCCDESLIAQNPLRLPAEGTLQRQHQGASQTQTPATHTPAQEEMSPEVREALYGAIDRSANTAPRQPAPTQPSNTIQDYSVQPAANVEAEIPKNDLEPVVRMLENFQPNNGQSNSGQPRRDSLSKSEFGQPLTDNEASDESKDAKEAAEVPGAQPSKLQDIAEKIIYNTLIVLSIGIGFVFVAKQYLKPKNNAPKKSDQTEFTVLSSMKLAPKSNLMLVEVGEDRLVIATDPTGIKSVVRLAESFASTLGDFENASAVEQASDPKSERAGSSGTYSLSSIGKSIASATAPQNTNASQDDNEEAIRKKMEVALAEHGLKELVLKTLQNSKT